MTRQTARAYPTYLRRSAGGARSLRAPGRVGGEEITIYKSLGRGIQDLVVARHLLGAS